MRLIISLLISVTIRFIISLFIGLVITLAKRLVFSFIISLVIVILKYINENTITPHRSSRKPKPSGLRIPFKGSTPPKTKRSQRLDPEHSSDEESNAKNIYKSSKKESKSAKGMYND